ncbi:MAG: MtnX-like HAD-IB family phosphatase [Bacillota bacterium]|nr:MtnX-like HAD-IB family phosphatase [Bacillota bacterium]
MEQKTAYLVDFDGTITTRDLSSELAAYYGGNEYMKIENEYRRRNIPIKTWLRRIARHLPPDLELLETKVLLWADIRPGFERFLEHARENGSPVIIASDGFGFYIEPILEEKGFLSKVSRIFRNETYESPQGLKIKNPHAHRICEVCGNCKAAHVVSLKEEGYSVVYIGDGSNDRFGASWSDLICARDRLAEICREQNFNYSQWIDFYDIIRVKKPDLYDRSLISLCCPLGDGVK